MPHWAIGIWKMIFLSKLPGRMRSFCLRSSGITSRVVIDVRISGAFALRALRLLR